MSDIADMLAAANAARANAHAPYSGFAVGSCLRGKSGRLYAGCNVENAAYPQGQCAEASAIGAMVAAGDRAISAVLASIPCPTGRLAAELALLSGRRPDEMAALRWPDVDRPDAIDTNDHEED